MVEILDGDPGRAPMDPGHVVVLAVELPEGARFSRAIKAIDYREWQEATESVLTLAGAQQDPGLAREIAGHFAAFCGEYHGVRPRVVARWLGNTVDGARRYCINKVDRLRVLDVMMRVLRHPARAEYLPAQKSGLGRDCWKVDVGKLRVLFDLSKDRALVIRDIDFRRDVYRKRGGSVYTS